MAWLLENWYVIVGPLLALFVPVYFVVVFVRFKRERKKSWESLEECAETDEPPFREIHGRVVEKHCYSDVAGTKNVRAYTCFYFLFLTDDGETVRYEIDEDTYLAIEDKTEGTVGIVGDQFYGFCPD
jgi:hypothetical protein